MANWRPIKSAPEGKWLRTKREGEGGENICLKHSGGGGEEWIERGTGRTTVTHSTFLPPTHWQPFTLRAWWRLTR